MFVLIWHTDYPICDAQTTPHARPDPSFECTRRAWRRRIPFFHLPDEIGADAVIFQADELIERDVGVTQLLEIFNEGRADAVILDSDPLVETAALVTGGDELIDEFATDAVVFVLTTPRDSGWCSRVRSVHE